MLEHMLEHIPALDHKISKHSLQDLALAYSQDSLQDSILDIIQGFIQEIIQEIIPDLILDLILVHMQARLFKQEQLQYQPLAFG